jgi:hypothetical protein
MVDEFVVSKDKAHNLFVFHRFHLLPDAEKPTQALIGHSIRVLCHDNGSAVEILDKDFTNAADAMAAPLTRHDFAVFF